MDTPPFVDLPPSSSTNVAGSSSHPPCRCEYPSSDEEAIEEPGLFDAATYVLPSRRLGFGGFLQYRPPVGGPEAERNKRLEARGRGKDVHKWFVTLPEQARELVHAVGFEAFVLGLNLPKMDWSLMTSLVERWWDTTNTFHLPSAGDMTITPSDFSLLIGLRVGGASLRVDPRLWERIGALEWFLGKVPPLHSKGHIDIAWLSKTYMKADILTQVSVEQLTRAFLLYLLGQTLFANMDSSVHTQFLAPLQHLGAIREFDWGSSALATLYHNLGACSRDKSPILGGHYRVLELYAFEHLLQFPTDTRHEDANCVPRFERWLMGQWKPRSPILNLPEWRRVPDRLSVNQDAPLVRSKVLDRTRSLLEGPFYRVWYLVLDIVDLLLEVPAEVVQEWLHAYQSAEALVRRQRCQILELEAERVPAAGGEDMGASEQSPPSSQRPSRRHRHD
ncbi:hypothetical protein RHMOL_Rhmol01G0153700 [Rhododendron molle]|uniref:Uncharacterized protein n=1 Tax=Rhododendron molle TaxID=49168 RepID=A0ACC0Q3C4_RHOML|nr:hypothetical protein RHMOL_Rhmol01G0153700 [Rhododendron molle]